jgi:hypothetical protein
MNRRQGIRRTVVAVGFVACLVGLSFGVSCPGGTAGSLNPAVPFGNRPPRLMITNVTTPSATVQAGDPVTITFTGEDAEDACVVRLFASTSSSPTPSQEIPILGGYPVGPGVGSGSAVWDTTGLANGTYYIFGEIDDRTYDPSTGLGNRAVRVTYGNTVVLSPQGTGGSEPLGSPPALVFIEPSPNLGLSMGDEVTIRYIFADVDGPSETVTLLLDKDLNPSNDDVNNPGNPLDPNSKIIILPSTNRLYTDPTFNGDPPPPDNAANPPTQADSLEIRKNPRTFTPTMPNQLPYAGAPMAGELKEYRFTIDFTQIPPRTEPYYIRAMITDGTSTANSYAVGSLTITQLATGVVDVAQLGFGVAGARFQGFSPYESLGSGALDCSDIDGDGVADFMLVGRLGGPRYRFLSGAAYLIFGRKKTPFPPDTNNNGLPDVTINGQLVDYPVPPTYVSNPYDSANVGRFGGKISINSVGGFFRGATYGMPKPHLDYDGAEANWYNHPPETLVDPNGYGGDPNAPPIYTAGLMSVARVNMVWQGTNDTGVPDFVFGLPFVSSAWDHVDSDPAEGCNGKDTFYQDLRPNILSTKETHFDDLVSPREPPSPLFENSIGQGLVIVVDGTNDLRTLFGSGYIDAGLAGQHDPDGALDDEGVIWSGNRVPDGMRFRGAYWDPTAEYLLDPNDPFSYYFTPYDRKPLDPTSPLLLGNAVFYSDSEFGRTVNRMPNFDNNPGDELLISSPGYNPLRAGYPSDPWDANTDLHRGRVQVWMSAGNYAEQGWYGQEVASLPAIVQCSPPCSTDPNNPVPFRCSIPQPIHGEILGEQPGDRFGFAAAAGDFNQDGVEDIIAGAPGASRNGKAHCGVVYIFACARGGFGYIDLADPAQRPRQVQIIGSHDNDQFGLVQTGIRDINHDGIQDVAVASEFFNANAGFVGVIFGGRPITGEEGFPPEAIGTASLPGICFLGAHAGDRVGHDVASAGDFNGDGVGDLLITAPGETRTVNGAVHKGVAYLIFGGQHLMNAGSYSLSQVGTSALPGIVFIGRLQEGATSGTNDHQVPLEIARGIGDIDDDGFDDIMIGAPTADFVFGASPNQRVPQAGEAYIIYGSNYGSNSLP